jgi:hypothetical protein
VDVCGAEDVLKAMKWIWTWLVLSAAALGADVVTLAWNESPEESVVGYRLYAGTNSRSYFMVWPVTGRVNTTNQMELPFPAVWYFAVTATNCAGLESGYSEEVVWPEAPIAPQIFAESYVRLVPQAERSTNMLTWEPVQLEPTLLPATNAQEFFRLTGLAIEPLRVVK